MAVDLFELRLNLVTSGLGVAKAELAGVETAAKSAALGATNFANAWEGAKLKFAGTAAEMAAFKAQFSAGFFNEKMIAGMSLAGREGAAASAGFSRMAQGIALASQMRKADDLAAQQNTLTYKALNGILNSSLVRFIGITAAISGVVGAYRSATSAVDAYRDSQIKLDGAARISGVSLSMLQGVSGQIQRQFRLSADQANDLTASAARMAMKTGDVNQTLPLLVSWLNVAAAQGMGAAAALQAMEITLRGQDEGLDRMFQKNPSVIWKEYAQSIGTTVGQLTDQQKWLSIVTATMQAHDKVGDAYERRLETTQGKSEQLDTKLNQLWITVGKLIDPFRQLGIAVGGWMTDGLINLLNRWNMALQESLFLGGKLLALVGIGGGASFSDVEGGSSTAGPETALARSPTTRSPRTQASGRGESAAERQRRLLAILDAAAPGTLAGGGAISGESNLALRGGGVGALSGGTFGGGGNDTSFMGGSLSGDLAGIFADGGSGKTEAGRMSILAAFANEAKRQAVQLKVQFAQVGTQLGMTLANGFANALGAAMSGKNPFKAFGDTVLKGLGSIFASMGQAMISAALPLIKLLPFLSNPLTSGPALLTAGIILTALGATLGGIATGHGGHGGGSGGRDSFADHTTNITLTPAGAGGSKAPKGMAGMTPIEVIGIDSPRGTAALSKGMAATKRRNM